MSHNRGHYRKKKKDTKKEVIKEIQITDSKENLKLF